MKSFRHLTKLLIAYVPLFNPYLLMQLRALLREIGLLKYELLQICGEVYDEMPERQIVQMGNVPLDSRLETLTGIRRAV